MLLTGAAFAQDAGLWELATPVYENLFAGNYAASIAAGVILLVALVRRYGGTYSDIFADALVAPILVLVGSAAGVVFTSTVTGAAFSGAIAWNALKIAVLASGSYSMAKPYLQALAKVAPAWAKPLIAVVVLIFDSKSGAKKAAAKKAGIDAVEANPGKGSDVDFVDFP